MRDHLRTNLVRIGVLVMVVPISVEGCILMEKRVRGDIFPGNERIPPEVSVPKGCLLHSVEPLREWFCKDADMTSPAEYEAALCQLEEDPPDIRQFNAEIREARWTHVFLGCEVSCCYC